MEPKLAYQRDTLFDALDNAKDTGNKKLIKKAQRELNDFFEWYIKNHQRNRNNLL